MNDAMAQDLVQGHITYLYTSPVGAIVVIMGVPALVDPNDSGDYTLGRPVAKRVQEIVRTSLSLNSAPNSVTSHNYEETVKLPSSTVEIIFRGENVQYGRIPLRTLRKSLERVDGTYRVALEGYAEAQGLDYSQLPEPTVPYLRRGSLVVAVRSTDQISPFAEVVDAGYESVRLVMGVVAWLNGDRAALKKEIIDNPELFDSLLNAAENLAPSKNDVFDEVEMVSTSDEQIEESTVSRERVILRRETRVAAEAERKIVALRSSRVRQVHFTGNIDGLRERDFKTREGILHIKVKRSPEDYKSGVAEFIYDNLMLPNILRAFSRGGEYVFRVQQKETRGKWDSKEMRLLEIIRPEIKRSDEPGRPPNDSGAPSTKIDS